jgi:hypothetical protein
MQANKERIKDEFKRRFIYVTEEWLNSQLNKNGLSESINFDYVYKNWLNTNLLEFNYSSIDIPDPIIDYSIPSNKFNILNSTFQIIKVLDVSRPVPNDYCEELYLKKNDYDNEEDNNDEQQNQQTQQSNNNKRNNNRKQPQQQNRFNNPQKSKTRQLYLELFNGKKIYKAFEYEPINQLNFNNCYVGAKLLITGEVDLSFDLILLRSKNVYALGGLRLEQQQQQQQQHN